MDDIAGAWMVWTRRRMIAGCGGAATLLVKGAGARQSHHPRRTLRIFRPHPAGASPDFVGRLVADQFQRGLRAAVDVENRPGSGTTIGAEKVAKAQPDGYTLLIATSTTPA